MEPVRLRLGELLVEAHIISRGQLENVLAIQQRDNRRLGTLLVEHGLVNETQLIQILSQQLSVPWVSLYHVDFSKRLLSLVPPDVAQANCLVPIFVRHVRGQGETLYVAMADPSNTDALRECAAWSGLPTRAMIASPSDIRRAIELYYDVNPPPVQIAPYDTLYDQTDADEELLTEEEDSVDNEPTDLTPAAAGAELLAIDQLDSEPTAAPSPTPIRSTPPTEPNLSPDHQPHVDQPTDQPTASFTDLPTNQFADQIVERPDEQISTQSQPLEPHDASVTTHNELPDDDPPHTERTPNAHDIADADLNLVQDSNRSSLHEVIVGDNMIPATEISAARARKARADSDVRIDIGEELPLEEVLREQKKSSQPPRRPVRTKSGTMMSLTLLDGTTLALPVQPRPNKRVDTLVQALTSEPTNPPETVEEPPSETHVAEIENIMVALRAGAATADSADQFNRLAHVEAMLTAVITVLVRKGLVTNQEILDETRRTLQSVR